MDFSSRNKVKAEWGMASMTDLIFLLLIFFIIMSLMANNQTPVNFPKKENNEKNTEIVDLKKLNPIVIVTIDDSNQYIVQQGDRIDAPVGYNKKMIAVIDSLVEKSGKNQLKIVGDPKADYEAVFNIIALAQSKKWEPILDPGKIDYEDTREIDPIIYKINAAVQKQGEKRKLKIAAYRYTDYEKIFKLLKIARDLNLNPVLAYEK
jgi:biopolymer transport protein ExbD